MNTIHNNKAVLEYWNKKNTESMYDKHLLKLEIGLITKQIKAGSKILDAGCGEGEGTLEYSKIPGVKVDAVDFSETRLKKAAKKLTNRSNIILKKIDFLKSYTLDKDYDYIISQRFLINLTAWTLQKKVLLDFKSMLKPGGKLILLEGSIEGVTSLNKFRKIFGLKPITVKWHNLFFDDRKLIEFMHFNGTELIEEEGFGEYFILTRGLRPIFENQLNWDSKFNKNASSDEIKKLLDLGTNCSRLKLWVFKKIKTN